jgi:hypothetical protein
MNSYSLNISSLNGASSDITQRAVILATAVAYLKPSNFTKHASAIIDQQLAAQITGKIGWVKSRATMAVVGVAGHKWAISAAGYTPIQHTYQAAVNLTAHIRARCAMAVEAQAVSGSSYKAWKRSPVAVPAEGSITAAGWSKPPTNVYAPVGQVAESLATVTAKVRARFVETTALAASVVADSHVRRRSPVVADGSATIFEINTVWKRIPWDYPAPEDRTFPVPPVDNYFYVS